MKITNHHDKQLTPSESWDQDGFFEPGYGYHQLQITGLEFLQRCGHQIRVNTRTGSYTKVFPKSSVCHATVLWKPAESLAFELREENRQYCGIYSYIYTEVQPIPSLKCLVQTEPSQILVFTPSRARPGLDSRPNTKLSPNPA